jgi:hypothetical protein
MTSSLTKVPHYKQNYVAWDIAQLTCVLNVTSSLTPTNAGPLYWPLQVRQSSVHKQDTLELVTKYLVFITIKTVH